MILQLLSELRNGDTDENDLPLFQEMREGEVLVGVLSDLCRNLIGIMYRMTKLIAAKGGDQGLETNRRALRLILDIEMSEEFGRPMGTMDIRKGWKVVYNPAQQSTMPMKGFLVLIPPSDQENGGSKENQETKKSTEFKTPWDRN